MRLRLREKNLLSLVMSRTPKGIMEIVGIQCPALELISVSLRVEN